MNIKKKRFNYIILTATEQYIESVLISQLITLERIQDRENVVGGNPEDTGGEEGETPSYTHHATQSHDD